MKIAAFRIVLTEPKQVFPFTLTIGNEIHFRWLKSLIGIIFCFNVLDGILTLFWVVTGRAVEANPFMADLLLIHPVVFMMSKMLLVMLGLCFLWLNRKSAFAIISIFFIFFVFYMVILHHCQTFDLLTLTQLAVH